MSGNVHFRGGEEAADETRVVVLRPGSTVVRDGATVDATVRVDIETGTERTSVYRGTSLADATDAAVEALDDLDALGDGGLVTVRRREYFRQYWSANRVADVTRRLRAAAYK
ncbi:hypothetical protein [Salarchaeum sp. JOR-1]|uniref:hypothetical protein n=1 Tax=Salarchaeum sp. JOR-1 TaxID=2599399 RepID=UPI0011989778|nr:hypothetical protein [Salarchaeum sp. JOR-1]QDX41739.1 hypothetical protein FQU85_12795 [Salarchaeum sp. JOR-1]